jgi:hypothetical protein
VTTGTGCITRRKRTEFASPLAVTLGLLTWIAANGCATSNKPAAVVPTSSPKSAASVDSCSPVSYFQLDSGTLLDDHNKGLRKWEFTREATDNKQRVTLILEAICGSMVEQVLYPFEPSYYSRPAMTSVPSTSMGWRPVTLLQMKDRNEPNEAIVADLIRDPEFVFWKDRWSTVVNVFTRDGAVEQCVLVGNVEPGTNLLQIRRMDIAHLKPRGTYRWGRIP